MNSRACAAYIAQVAFTEHGSAGERRQVRAAEKSTRRARRFRRHLD